MTSTLDQIVVTVLDPISPTAEAALAERYDVRIRLRPPPQQLATAIRDADVLVVRSGVQLPGAILAQAPAIRVIARAGSGIDNIDVEWAREDGVIVFNIPSTSSRSVAELALGLLLDSARHVTRADREVRSELWHKAALVGTELYGRTVGVIGLGAIGSKLARTCVALGMSVLATVADADPARAERWRDEGVELVDLAQLCRRSDFVVVACSLTAASHQLIGAAELDLMTPSTIVVNVARAGVLDESALLERLSTGRLGGAALDVHDHEGGASPFAGLNNVVLTPHIGAMTRDAQEAIGTSLVRNIDAALTGQTVENRIC